MIEIMSSLMFSNKYDIRKRDLFMYIFVNYYYMYNSQHF